MPVSFNRVVIEIDPTVTDLGVAINAADAQLGATPGAIIVPDGGPYSIATPIFLSSNRTLQFGAAVYHTTVAGAAVINLRKNRLISITGAGPATMLRESVNAGKDGTQLGYEFIRFDDDGSTEWFGDLDVADLTLSGTGVSNPGNGTAQAISLGNAKRVTIRNVRLVDTHSIGIGVGGSGLTGNFAEDVIIEGCSFDGVATQHIGAVNFRNLRIVNNTFMAGSASVGTYIDLEANTAADHLENFVISGNVIDVGTEAQAWTYGIAVQGGHEDADLAQNGPGVISNNSVVGLVTRPPPAPETFGMAQAVVLLRMRDVLVEGNNFRRGAIVMLEKCTRCAVVNNRFQSFDGGGTPLTLLSATTYSHVSRNLYVHVPTAAVSNDYIEEKDGSDWNLFVDNYISFAAGTWQPPYLASPTLIVVGPNSRQINNFFGDKLNLEGFTVDARKTRPGQSLVYNGGAYLPTDARTSDNAVTMHHLTDAPDFFSGPIAPFELGFVFSSSRSGFISALRFYKDPADTQTQHTFRIWDGDFVGLPALLTAATQSETASGWQQLDLASPFPVTAGKSYVVAYVTGSSFVAKSGTWAAAKVRPPLAVPARGGRFVTVPAHQPQLETDFGYLVDIVFEVNQARAHNTVEKALATTNPTDILLVQTPQPGNYLVSAYYRIVNSATKVTLVAAWDDVGGPRMQSLVDKRFDVGAHTVPPIYLNVQPTGPLRLTMTSAVAGNVFASATALLL